MRVRVPSQPIRALTARAGCRRRGARRPATRCTRRSCARPRSAVARRSGGESWRSRCGARWRRSGDATRPVRRRASGAVASALLARRPPSPRALSHPTPPATRRPAPCHTRPRRPRSPRLRQGGSARAARLRRRARVRPAGARAQPAAPAHSPGRGDDALVASSHRRVPAWRRRRRRGRGAGRAHPRHAPSGGCQGAQSGGAVRRSGGADERARGARGAAAGAGDGGGAAPGGRRAARGGAAARAGVDGAAAAGRAAARGVAQAGRGTREQAGGSARRRAGRWACRRAPTHAHAHPRPHPRPRGVCSATCLQTATSVTPHGYLPIRFALSPALHSSRPFARTTSGRSDWRPPRPRPPRLRCFAQHRATAPVRSVWWRGSNWRPFGRRRPACPRAAAPQRRAQRPGGEQAQRAGRSPKRTHWAALVQAPRSRACLASVLALTRATRRRLAVAASPARGVVSCISHRGLLHRTYLYRLNGTLALSPFRSMRLAIVAAAALLALTGASRATNSSPRRGQASV